MSWLNRLWKSGDTTIPPQQGPSTKRDKHPPIVQRINQNQPHRSRKRQLDQDDEHKRKKAKVLDDACVNDTASKGSQGLQGEFVLPVRKCLQPEDPGGGDREAKKVKSESEQDHAPQSCREGDDVGEEFRKTTAPKSVLEQRYQDTDQAIADDDNQSTIVDNDDNGPKINPFRRLSSTWSNTSVAPTRPQRPINLSKPTSIPPEDRRSWAREPLRGIGRWRGSDRVPGQQAIDHRERDTPKLPKPDIGRLKENSVVTITGSEARARYRKMSMENVVLPLLFEKCGREERRPRLTARERQLQPKKQAAARKEVGLKGFWGRSVGKAMGPKEWSG